jgi:5-methylcytosine-specific restriction endonuclease McrA
MIEDKVNHYEGMKADFGSADKITNGLSDELFEIGGKVSILALDCVRTLSDAFFDQDAGGKICLDYTLRAANIVNEIRGIAGQCDLAWTNVSNGKEHAENAVQVGIEAYESLSRKSAARVKELVSEITSLRYALNQKEERLSEHQLHSPEVREKIWNITGGRCFYCDVEMTREKTIEEPGRCFNIDHLVAKANGGPDHVSNYVPACHRCNVSKNAKPFVEFFRWRGEPELRVVGGTDASG